MDIQEKIVEILAKVKPTKDLKNVCDIVEGGYLDSFELMLLISSLEETFHTQIDVTEISPENFNSVEVIGQMIVRLGGHL